jgi:hypothetical protein
MTWLHDPGSTTLTAQGCAGIYQIKPGVEPYAQLLFNGKRIARCRMGILKGVAMTHDDRMRSSGERDAKLYWAPTNNPNAITARGCQEDYLISAVPVIGSDRVNLHYGEQLVVVADGVNEAILLANQHHKKQMAKPIEIEQILTLANALSKQKRILEAGETNELKQAIACLRNALKLSNMRQLWGHAELFIAGNKGPDLLLRSDCELTAQYTKIIQVDIACFRANSPPNLLVNNQPVAEFNPHLLKLGDKLTLS